MTVDAERCIWMDAHAVGYKLCPLKQNCDVCDFHQQMLQGCPEHPSLSSSALLSLRFPNTDILEFIPGVQYLDGHFWYQRVAKSRVRLGIDAFLWQLFDSTVSVELPAEGTKLVTNQCFAWLLIEGGMAYLKTPLPGTISNVNPRFGKSHGSKPLFYLSPLSDLWLVEIKLAENALHGTEPMSKQSWCNALEQDLGILNTRAFISGSTPPVPDSHVEMSKRELALFLKMISKGRILIC